ncbi:MAG: YezD family protein [Methylomonas sp.]|nr:YezD family protein [Methylomonas sp.]PPD21665.1 MAG: DUF2292 domain-containing protein [Methylomonas sp.]PPD25954.1 MAG: DUF2292 domain-containing protein [Methylomonas sp.]PPD37690.1 MAG: DUF2292 domain-containing protein [Methylomonas sp.]PPD39297.1 MAG: DUF2292 domain-containing protein [Methylomonas sp.]
MIEQSENPSATADEAQTIASQIVSLLKNLRFGSIEILVHEGRIVQIDRHEKFRIRTGPNKY